ncbi:hypothetical protein KO526_19890 [Reichenbachiella agariperforans]|nr:hypothetical protein [Reichenbachiella agariperforans]
MKVFVVTWICMLGTCLGAVAGAQLDTLQINYIGQEEGMTQLNVQDVVQDDMDYLWFSTEDGLHRFNGLKMKVFSGNPLDSMSIPDDHNRGLLIVDDTLWIASNSKGIFALDLRSETFIRPFDELSNVISYKVFRLNDQYLLFSSSNAFHIYDRSIKTLKKVVHEEQGSENHVTALVRMSEDQAVLATLNGGLLVLDLKTLSVVGQQRLDPSAHNALLLHQEQLYVGTEQGLYTLDLSSGVADLIVPDQSINCIYPYENGELWLGTNEGLVIYDPVSKSVTQCVSKDQLGKVYFPVEIMTIYGDGKGNVWMGTAGEGLHHYNKYQKKFTSISLEMEGYTRDTKLSTFQFLPAEGEDSALWLGSTYNVLKYDYLTREFKHYKDDFPKSLIYALERDHNGDVWCGGFDGTGLLHYNAAQDRFEKAEVTGDIPNDKSVIDIRPLTSEKLLVSTWSSGMYIYDLTQKKFEGYLVDGQALNRARISFVDSQDNLWIGSDQGAYRIAELGEGVVHHYTEGTHPQAINSDRIFAINEDGNGNIWLGTSTGLTMLNLKTEDVHRYYRQEGFPNDFVYSVLIDAQDRVWMGTNKGIAVLDPSTDRFVHYSHKDGLQNDEFNGKAAYQDGYGNFYFGGVDGINVFHPEDIRINPYESKVHLESIELFNQPLPTNAIYQDRYAFGSDENVLTFKYAAINFLNPSKVNYSYWMDGFDKEWRPVTKSQSITYTNLSPGDYTFHIKATNDNGAWSEMGRQVSLTVIPPWYDQFWFKLTAVLATLLLAVGFYLYKSHTYRRNKERLELMVKESTGELRQALEVSESRQESIQFLMREMKHRVKNNLQIISSLLSLQALHLDNLDAIHTLQVARNRILTISYLENIMDSESEHIHVDKFTRDICENVLRLIASDESPTFETIYDLEPAEVTNFNITFYGLLINELLTNVSKYAFDNYEDTNRLSISCKVGGDWLVLVIADNGKGYRQEDIKQGSIGLDLVKDMVKQLKGEMTVDSHDGAKNVIKIPVSYGEA